MANSGPEPALQGAPQAANESPQKERDRAALPEEPPLFSALDGIWPKEERQRYRPILVDALEAIAVLSRVDERVFAFREESRRAAHEGVGPREDLAKGSQTNSATLALSQEILSPIRTLASRLSMTDDSSGSGGDLNTFEIDFSMNEGESFATEKDEFSSQDIFGALDALKPERELSATERKKKLDKEIASFAFGLNRQLDLCDQRLTRTMEEGQTAKALQELEDAVETFAEGLVALIAAVSKPYLESFDRAKLLPRHRTSLERALVTRSGLADLRREVTAENIILQDAHREASVRDQALHALRGALARFVESDAFTSMRAAERFQITSMGAALESKPIEGVMQEAEGLAKYLDSLAMVATRDTVVQHDREVMKSAADLLEAAHSVVSVSIVNAQKLARDALDQLPRLYGMRDGLDDLLIGWRKNPPNLETAEAITELIDRLYEVEPRLNAVH